MPGSQTVSQENDFATDRVRCTVYEELKLADIDCSGIDAYIITNYTSMWPFCPFF